MVFKVKGLYCVARGVTMKKIKLLMGLTLCTSMLIASSGELADKIRFEVQNLQATSPKSAKALNASYRILDRFGVFKSAQGKIEECKQKSRLHKTMPFVPHVSPKFYGTYLVYNVNFAPVNEIKRKIESATGLELIDRGEAHITVLTPPEHDAIKKVIPEFSMDEINGYVSSFIQDIKWENMGVGTVKGKNHKDIYSEVFFLVVRSEGLRSLRRMIARMYQIPEDVFDPEIQDFHVTIGYTESDLHGVAKDATTLVKDLIR
jgi:2'-5' RNA ligase